MPCRNSTLSKRCNGKPSTYLVVSGMHALFDQLGWLVGSDWCSFATTATVNFAHVFDHANLHRHDLQLLAGFFADDMLAATADTGQFVFWQVVDDFDTR